MAGKGDIVSGQSRGLRESSGGQVPRCIVEGGEEPSTVYLLLTDEKLSGLDGKIDRRDPAPQMVHALIQAAGERHSGE